MSWYQTDTGVFQSVFFITMNNESSLRALPGDLLVRCYSKDSIVSSCYVWWQDGCEHKMILILFNGFKK